MYKAALDIHDIIGTAAFATTRAPPATSLCHRHLVLKRSIGQDIHYIVHIDP